ncbi:MAG: GMC family oxidoreductase [Acidobacteria bacterium]|nr:GMC family oxidoreductase [Acidobacteriota bacterium]
MKLDPVDAVVVGAGAGGGVVAYVLAKAGLRVVLLERGRQIPFEESGHDELRSQRTTVLGNAFGPDSEQVRMINSPLTGKFYKVRANENAYNNVAACVGGGTASYGAMAWRFHPKDFQMLSTYGLVAGSTLEDWPITYEELEPYYEKAEYEIGVSGKAGSNPFDGPRKKGYPMPPLPFNKEATLLAGAARKKGWHPFPIPMLINSVERDGRAGCIACPHCVGFGCEVDAKNGTQNTVVARAVKTGNCTLLTEAVAKEVLTNEQGKATGVAYFHKGELVEQPARVVVVACSATETPRLLLNSKSKMHPKGLGNHNDWLGRNLQGHAYSGAYGLFEEEVFDGTGPAARVALCDFNHGNKDVVGGSMLANEFIRMPYLFARGVRPARVPRYGLEFKKWVREGYKRTAGVKGPVQEMPLWENRVEVDEAVKDQWGIPVAAITTRRHPMDAETGKFMAERAAEWLKAAGAVETWLSVAGLGGTGGQHQAGTCRMGKDAKTSVTDSYGRLHSVDNVYVADGSLHVTNGGFNPSLTIMALGFRVGERIARDWRRRA